MELVALILLALCYGLSYWEFHVRMRLGKDPYEWGHSSGLPLLFATPVFKVLKLLGSIGVVLVPLLYWNNGLMGVVAALAVFFVVGTIFGIAVPAIVNRL